MYIRTAYLLLSAVAALGLMRPAAAQGKPAGATLSAQRLPVWVEGALGYGRAGAGPDTEAGGHLAGRLAARAVAGRLAVTARLGTTTGGRSSYRAFSLIGSGTLYDAFHDAGLLAGYALPLGKGVEASGSAGLGVVWGTRAVSTNCNSFCFATGERDPFALRPAIPMELGLSAHVRDGLRLGILGYLNLNTEEAFGGLLLTGSLRLP